MVFDRFAGEGNWYKGNLHCHSIKSDGRMTCEELKTAYIERGYSFVAFSDHNRYIDTSYLSEPGFLALPAIELGIIEAPNDCREFHFGGILGSDEMLAQAKLPVYQSGECPGPVPFKEHSDLQRMIDDLKDRGFFVIFNHPHWSLNELTDILPLKRLDAMEVYNHSSQHIENMGDDRIIWESAVRAGMKLWCVATDDNHNKHPLDDPSNDLGGGWICVKAKALTRNHIIEAMNRGCFYSSAGPEIKSFRVEDNVVTFECSPVEKIYISGNARQYARNIGAAHEDTVTLLRKKLDGTETFVRGECIDKYGRRAFTNPIYLNGD